MISENDIVLEDTAAWNKKIPYLGVQAMRRALNQEFDLGLNQAMNSKDRILRILTNQTNHKLTRRFYSRLMLSQAICHNNKTPLWFAYDLNSVDNSELRYLAKAELAQYLKTELEPFFQVYVLADEDPEGNAWFFVQLVDSNVRHDIWIVHPPLAPAIFVTRQRVKIRPFIKAAIKACFKADIAVRGVKSKRFDALAALVLYRDASGAFRRYQSGAEPTPLERDRQAGETALLRGEARRKRTADQKAVEKRRRLDAVDDLEEVEGHVGNSLVHENQEQRDLARRNAEATFGTADALPIVNRVELQLKKPYAGIATPGSDVLDQELSIRVQIRGENVLKGVHAMISNGIIKQPLPSIWVQLSNLKKMDLTDADDEEL